VTCNAGAIVSWWLLIRVENRTLSPPSSSPPSSSPAATAAAAADGTGRSLYLKACSDSRIKPNIRVLQGLESPTLDLADCGLRPQDAQALAACLPANTACSVIVLDNNRMGDEGFAAVLHALADSPRVTLLSSAYNGITARCADALKNFGAKNHKCKVLCLRGNRLSDAGVKCLVEGICSNSACVLAELDLADNKFSTRGGAAVSVLLRENRSITDLDVSCVLSKRALPAVNMCDNCARRYNCMRPPACAAVLQAFQRNDSVAVFSIGWNGVGSQGCQALADALRVRGCGIC